MAIYEMSKEAVTPLAGTRFGTEGVYERRDLQRLLKTNIGILGDDLMVIAEEYGDWEDSGRRIDLLCLDKTANLVVVEIKRTEIGGHMELQALRYAAMVSPMKFQQLVDAHAVFRRGQGLHGDDSQTEILGFLGWDEVREEDFAKDVRIVLAAADFSK